MVDIEIRPTGISWFPQSLYVFPGCSIRYARRNTDRLHDQASQACTYLLL